MASIYLLNGFAKGFLEGMDIRNRRKGHHRTVSSSSSSKGGAYVLGKTFNTSYLDLAIKDGWTKCEYCGSSYNRERCSQCGAPRD